MDMVHMWCKQQVVMSEGNLKSFCEIATDYKEIRTKMMF
jgi:hypothetical protein